MTDFQPFSTPDLTVTVTNDIAIQLFSRNDYITLEYNDTVILRFIVHPGLAPLIQQLEAAGEYIRDTATVDIIDNDRKQLVLLSDYTPDIIYIQMCRICIYTSMVFVYLLPLYSTEYQFSRTRLCCQ